MPQDEQETLLLVLRKSPYSESSLIVAGLTPEYGQLHFLLRGGRRLGARQFPLVDLFRVLKVRFREGRGELQRWSAAEVSHDFSAVALQYRNYQAAVWLARFTLANCAVALPQQRFFQALCVALRRLQTVNTATAIVSVVIPAVVVFLHEHGVLSDYAERPRAAAQCRQLLQAGLGEAEIPALAPAAWKRLQQWVEALLQFAACRFEPFPVNEVENSK